MTHLSRISLTDAGLARSAANSPNLYAHHQQVWRFYGDDPDADRDFLYRFDKVETGPRFYAVSARPPKVTLPGWRIETRPYDAAPERGARLRFSLRANPTKRIAQPGKRSDGRRHDVVMARKFELQQKGEAVDMRALVQETGLVWLRRQGERHGFRFEDGNVRADGYQSHRFPRARDAHEMSITGIDYEGMLEVTEPGLFGLALRTGIGPAKGFGFGLLLVRRP